MIGQLLSPAAMNIGDHVLHHGRVYVLRGLDPMSVPERDALLEDGWTGELIRVPLDEVECRRNDGSLSPEA
jgi:hypothetical protein